MRVLLCDQHLLLLECIAAVFEARGHTVEQALTPQGAIELMTGHGADVCVIDLFFPKTGEGEAVARVRRSCPETTIVAFTAASDPRVLLRARESGADGYVSKNESVNRLVELVERLPGDPDAGPESWNRRLAQRRPEAAPHDLTPRELQTLEGLVRGKNTLELARWMGVRESTVAAHVQTVLTKLGVHSRLEAVAFATAERLVAIGR